MTVSHLPVKIILTAFKLTHIFIFHPVVSLAHNQIIDHVQPGKDPVYDCPENWLVETPRYRYCQSRAECYTWNYPMPVHVYSTSPWCPLILSWSSWEASVLRAVPRCKASITVLSLPYKKNRVAAYAVVLQLFGSDGRIRIDDARVMSWFNHHQAA